MIAFLFNEDGIFFCFYFFFSSRRRHTRSLCDWSSDVCSSDLALGVQVVEAFAAGDPVHALQDQPQPSEAPYPAEIAAVVDHDRPPPDRQGLVLFFTGLSGS